jgi:hypothetical protein
MIHSTLRRFGPRKKKSGDPSMRDLEDMTLGELEGLLDAEVSLWVRGSAALEADAEGLVPCYTCGRLHPWKELDAGHYIGQKNRGVRWDLRNVRPQDTRCNTRQEGEHWKFRMNLVVEIGEDQVKDLEFLASQYGESKMPREWLIEQIRAWRLKTASLRKELKVYDRHD